jgi:hypothetical protein
MHSLPIAVLFALAGFVALWRAAKLCPPRHVSCPMRRERLARITWILSYLHGGK